MSSAKPTTTSPAPRFADRYIRCDDFAERIEGIELAPEVWAVFAQLTQSRHATELAQHLQLDVEAVNASLRRLVRRKLIRKHVLGWRDYTATHAPFPVPASAITTPSAAPTPSVPPFYVQPAPTPVAAIPAPTSAPIINPPAVRSPILSFRISGEPKSLRPAPAISLRIGPASQSASVPSALNLNLSSSSGGGGLRLRPILDAIGAKAGGGVAGQLLVYRIFLQIPTALMQAAGLHSLSLVDDQFTLHHPELRAALAETARRQAGVDIEALAAPVA